MEADQDHDGKISFEEFTKMVENTDVSMSMTLGMCTNTTCLLDKLLTVLFLFSQINSRRSYSESDTRGMNLPGVLSELGCWEQSRAKITRKRPNHTIASIQRAFITSHSWVLLSGESHRIGK